MGEAAFGLLGVGGLPSALQGALSLSASGFPFFAADTGGYRHSPASKETWIRWVEQSALSTVMYEFQVGGRPLSAQSGGGGEIAATLAPPICCIE